MHCKDINEIQLANCEIKDSGAIALFDVLKKHKDLKIVNLEGNVLTDKCLESLFALVNLNKKV